MKVEQKLPRVGFIPVIITLETQDEVEDLIHGLINVDIDDLDDDIAEKTIDRLFDMLNEFSLKPHP